jgi:hypothetical protein
MGLTKGPFYNLFMKVSIKLTILFSLFLFSEQLFAQDIEGYLHAVGGKENLKSTINIRLSYTVEYYPSKHEQPKSYAIIKIVNDKGFYRCEYYNEVDGKSLLVFDGKEMMEIRPTGYIYKLSGNEIDEYRRREIYFGEAWLALNAERINYIGEERVSSIDCYVYDINSYGMTRKFYIGKNDSLLHKVTMYNGVTSLILSDYQSIGPFKIPLTRIGYINNQIESVTHIGKVEFNIDLPNTFFEID